MKKILLCALLACLPPLAFSQATTLIQATKIIDNTGAPLASGQWCLNSTCFAVTGGVIANGSTVTNPTAGIVKVTNGGSTTYLTVPGVTASGFAFNWDTYVVPSTGVITGIGPPRIACSVGSQYTQTDGTQSVWSGISTNGVCTWNGMTFSSPLVGPTGPAGATGATGAIGPEGPPANFRGIWNSSTTYAAGDWVTYNTAGVYSGYASLVAGNIDHTPPTSGSYWVLTTSGGVANPTGAAGSIQANNSGVFGPASLLNMGAAVVSPTDGSTVLNNSAYAPFALTTGNFGNVFIGTGSMAYGTSGSVGTHTGNNVAIGQQALHDLVNGGSVVAIGVQSCANENGDGNADPGAGNGVCIGAEAGANDSSMADFVVIGQKAYTDANPGSAGGLVGSVVVGVHTDGIDGWTSSTVLGDYNTRYTNNLPITGSNNTITGTANLSCLFCSGVSGAQAVNYLTLYGNGNLSHTTTGFAAQYAVAVGTYNLQNFNAGSISGTTVASSVAVGNNDLINDVTGVDDTAVGNNVLQNATSSLNVGMGDSACSALTTGNCTAFGYSAGNMATTGQITAFGENAAAHSTAASIDVFGVAAGYNVSGTGDVFIGDTAGASAGAASNTVAVGQHAGGNDASAGNVYVGYGAGSGAATTAGGNTGIGESSLNTAGTTVTGAVAVGLNSTCASCTNSEMLGANAIVGGTTAGAAQIGAGTNSTANTLQFRSANFLTSANLATHAGYGQSASNSTGGSCTMSSSSTCSLTIGFTYTTPICVATVQGSSPLAGACSISGRVITVTAASSNSSSWGIWVFGNPN